MVHVTVQGSIDEIVGWITARWIDRPNVGLHIPLWLRDAMSVTEWVDALGHFPTFSVVDGGHAEGPNGLIELYVFKVRP